MEQYIAQDGDDMRKICDCPRLSALGELMDQLCAGKGGAQNDGTRTSPILE